MADTDSRIDRGRQTRPSALTNPLSRSALASPGSCRKQSQWMNCLVEMRLPCIGGASETYLTSPSPVCIEIVSRYDGVSSERLIDEMDGLHVAAALVQMHTGRQAIQLLNLAEIERPDGSTGVVDHALIDRLLGVTALSCVDVGDVVTGLLANWPEPGTKSDPQREIAIGLSSWLKHGAAKFSARAVHVALEAHQAHMAHETHDVLWWTAAADAGDAQPSLLMATPDLRVTRSGRRTRLTAAEMRSIRACAVKDAPEHDGDDIQGFSLRTLEIGSGGIDTAATDYRVLLLFSILQAVASHLIGGRAA